MSAATLDSLPTHEEAAAHAAEMMTQAVAAGVVAAGHPAIQSGGWMWQRAYRDASLKAERAAAAEATDGLTAASAGVVDPEGFWASDRREIQHLMAQARRFKLSPWAMLGGTLGRAAASIPYDIPFRSFLGRRPVNLLLAVVGSTGGGKTATENAVAEIFDFGRDLGYAHEVGSGEAIASLFGHIATRDDKELDVKRGDLIWRSADHMARVIFDEVGRLNAVQARQGATVLEYLKSGESGAPLGRKLAAGDGIEIPPNAYRLVATLNVQPARAHLIMSADEAAGGLPGRMLWLDSEYAPFVGLRRDGRYPERMRLGRPDWRGIETIEATGDMEAEFDRQRDLSLAGALDPMESHSAMLRAKVAACLMAMAGRAALVDEDWDLAGLVIEHSRRTRRKVLRAIAQADQEAAGAGDVLREQTVLAQMRKKRAQGMTMGAARKSLGAYQRTLWDGLLATGAAESW
ncbi:ATP-binding protein [Microbacterium dextranolyticum]|uniref:Uncharacterized protein n=1 Tax=Microbacterium dextranolyticum TaxID=36806 RepID=A0A9W6M6K3_9MICO|nr:ATP-binding protein [Microbacterium dextranolyticum]MBM7462924.1 hypothetical protein [Microbacterium dextranolyticum]GLJ95971.1 hypothetical protein GCM10017591_20340 [Microbacterium dextranolyticum]